jgi:hypothetical protein
MSLAQVATPYDTGCRLILIFCVRVTPVTLTARLVICYPHDEYYFRRKAVQAYCVKCRAKREMKDAKAITMKNGKPATQGVCPTCGTKMFRIGKI